MSQKVEPKEGEAALELAVCPFSSNHRVTPSRFVWHVSSCGERKGRKTYRCQYSAYHLFLTEAEAAAHSNGSDCIYKKQLLQETEAQRAHAIQHIDAYKQAHQRMVELQQEREQKRVRRDAATSNSTAQGRTERNTTKCAPHGTEHGRTESRRSRSEHGRTGNARDGTAPQTARDSGASRPMKGYSQLRHTASSVSAASTDVSLNETDGWGSHDSEGWGEKSPADASFDRGKDTDTEEYAEETEELLRFPLHSAAFPDDPDAIIEQGDPGGEEELLS